MKAIISIPYLNYYGGPGTFIEHLTTDNSEFFFINHLNKNVDIILVIVYYNFAKLLYYKLVLKKKIILRLDGITKYNKPSLKKLFITIIVYHSTKLIYKYLADFVVLQSRYVESDVFLSFGKTIRPSSIIYNGVRRNKISNIESIPKDLSIVYWASSVSHNDYLLLSKIANELRTLIPNSRIQVYGRLNWNYNSITFRKENIKFYGEVSREEIHSVAMKSDIFLMIKGSASPNSLVECLAYEVAVVGFDEMGNSEIIDNTCGVLFKRSLGQDANVLKFLEGIQKVQTNIIQYKSSIKRRYQSMFTAEIMQKNYNYLFHKIKP